MDKSANPRGVGITFGLISFFFMIVTQLCLYMCWYVCSFHFIYFLFFDHSIGVRKKCVVNCENSYKNPSWSLLFIETIVIKHDFLMLLVVLDVTIIVSLQGLTSWRFFFLPGFFLLRCAYLEKDITERDHNIHWKNHHVQKMSETKKSAENIEDFLFLTDERVI